MDSDYDSDSSYWCYTSRGYLRTAPSKPEINDDDSFSENGNPDHFNPHPSPSETNPHEPDYNNPNPNSTLSKLDDNEYQDPTLPEPNHHNEKRESESEYNVDKGYEPERLEYEDNGEYMHGGMDWDNEYEPEGLEYNNSEVCTHGELQYEHRELEDEEFGLHKHEVRGHRTQGDQHKPHQLMYELESGNDRTHEPRELKYETQGLNQLRYKANELTYQTDGICELAHPIPPPTTPNISHPHSHTLTPSHPHPPINKVT
jgi:hypothetical protein